jgi:hypothetical protein
MEEKSEAYRKAESLLAAVLFILFCIWCPTYLILVRPIINEALAPYISAYPAILHLIPILTPIVLVALAVAPFMPEKK